MNKNPLETKLSEGLAKIHEAGELLSDEMLEKLAEKAQKDAEESKKRHRKQHES